MYLLFVDESGTHGGSHAFTFGGLAIHEDDAARLQRRLDEAVISRLGRVPPNLDEYEVHASDLRNAKKPAAQGEKVGTIPVPPKYTSVDFVKQSYWQARGKLDVPKERFIAYPNAGRDTDATPLLGWAGWDDARLVPLVAGLAELQPWVEQWHADVDPTFGISLAAFCREQLHSRAAQVGKALDELAAWRPAAPTRGRRPRNGRPGE